MAKDKSNDDKFDNYPISSYFYSLVKYAIFTPYQCIIHVCSFCYSLSFPCALQGLFEMLPCERRLPTEELKEAEKLVALQVNNKLMRDHFEEKTGKKIILKDISNIISKVNLSRKSEDLESLVNKLKKTGMIADSVDS